MAITQVLSILPPFLLIVLAAISKALADTVAFHGGGIFKGKDFFDINKQGKFLPLTKYPLDAFHLSNSSMIFSFIIALVFPCDIVWWLEIPILGTAFNLTFNLFWNHIFN